MIDYSVWPAFLIVAVLIVLFATPAGRLAHSPPHRTSQRLDTLDGLRGLLALSVAIHHAVIYRRWIMDGTWVVPQSLFYARLGPIGVSLFFMITGYLFWSRMFSRPTPLDGRYPGDWAALYIGRIFRIGPVFVFTITCAGLGVVMHDGFRLLETLPQIWAHIGTTLLLGLDGFPMINDDPYMFVLLAGVIWTLKFEWWFYASLPFTAVMARFAPVAFPSLALILCLVLDSGTLLDGTLINGPLAALIGKIALFLVGMCVASLHRFQSRTRISSALGGIIVVAALGASVWMTRDYSVGFILLMAIVFYFVASGCSVWGLLLSRGAQRLGNISYPIYLLQGLCLALAMLPPPLRRLTIGSRPGAWTTTALALLLLVGSAMVVHVTIERPGIALGRRVIGRLGLARLDRRGLNMAL